MQTTSVQYIMKMWPRDILLNFLILPGLFWYSWITYIAYTKLLVSKFTLFNTNFDSAEHVLFTIWLRKRIPFVKDCLYKWSFVLVSSTENHIYLNLFLRMFLFKSMLNFRAFYHFKFEKSERLGRMICSYKALIIFLQVFNI